MSAPHHAIVVAAHNAADTLGLTMASVLRQRDPDFELIIVDDGSTDETLDLARSQADDRIAVHTQVQAGPGAARNAGMATARAELVTFLDSDDLLMPDYLAAMRDAFERAPDVGLAHADAWVLNRARGRIMVDRGERWHFEAPESQPKTAADALVALAHGNYIGGVRTARRAAAIEAGGFATDFRHGEDYDLWVRMALEGHRVEAEGRLAVISDRPGSLSKNEPAMVAGTREVCLRLIARPECPLDARAAAQAQLALLDQWAADLRFTNPARGAFLRARRAFRRLRENTFPWRFWHSELPPEVAEAFPELRG